MCIEAPISLLRSLDWFVDRGSYKHSAPTELKRVWLRVCALPKTELRSLVNSRYPQALRFVVRLRLLPTCSPNAAKLKA